MLVGPLTWFEEHHGLHAGKFSGVNSQGLEAAEGLLQRADVQGGGQQLPRGRLGDSQQGTALQGHGPLDGTQQEQLAPCFFQQDHLGTWGEPQKPPSPLKPPRLVGLKSIIWSGDLKTLKIEMLQLSTSH